MYKRGSSMINYFLPDPEQHVQVSDPPSRNWK